MLKTLLIRFGWVVFEKVSKIKNRNLDFSEVHIFLEKKLGVIIYAAKLTTTRSSHLNQKLRFGRVVFEKKRKVSKNTQKSYI